MIVSDRETKNKKTEKVAYYSIIINSTCLYIDMNKYLTALDIH